MKNLVSEKLDIAEIDHDELDKFEFEEQDELREFFEDDISDEKDLIL